MEENRKKREWVKSAAIIFLSVMLVLTFFSNTIMNYSLPEVATEHITSGTITSKIRGTGVVESGDPYNVQVMGTRKVSGIPVSVGDKVNKEDIILYLEDEESEELIAAEKALKALQDEYDALVLSGMDISIVGKVESGNASSVADYKSKLDVAKKEMEAVQTEIDSLTSELNGAKEWEQALNLQIGLEKAKAIDISAESNAKALAEASRDNAKVIKEQIQAEYDALLAQPSPAPELVTEVTERLNNAVSELDRWENEVLLSTQAYNNAYANKLELDAQVNSTVLNLTNQVAHTNVRIQKIQNDINRKDVELAQKKKVFEDLVGVTIPAEMNLVKKLEQIAEAQEEVNKLREKSVGATVTAGVAGTVISINITSGELTNPATPVAVIQPEGKGYTLSFSVTKEQASRVTVGDPADLVNAWWGSDFEAVVQSIRPDPNNPAQNKLITFRLTGEVTTGQSLTLSVGQKSAEYSTIVPNSAIREDNNGKFILIVEQKSSALGNRFMATRVDVEVLASDETKSAIKGAVYGYENVIVTATQPIEAGQQIRLPD